MKLRQGMKFTKLSLAVGLVAGVVVSVHAQDTSGFEGIAYKNGANEVKLYGLLEADLIHKTNSNSDGQSLTTLSTPWFSGSRWGIAGARGLGDSGLKAIFKLESEYNVATGAEDTAGVLFNRDSWLGVESKTLGKLTVGRQNTVARDFAGTYGDAYGKMKVGLDEGGFQNTNNFKNLVYYAGGATGTRYDRGVVWKKEIDNFVIGLGVQLVESAGTATNTKTQSTALAYNGNGYTLAGFTTTASVKNYSHKSSSFGGSIQVNELVRLNAGVFSYSSDQKTGLTKREDKAATVSALFTPKGKTDYALGYVTMNAKNAALDSSGYVYNAYADNSASTTNILADGKRNTVYASAMYHMDKVTDFYVVMDKLTLANGWGDKGANGKSSQTAYGVGMRFRF
jgi:predicted porin